LFTAGMGDYWRLAVVTVPRLRVATVVSGRWGDVGSDKQGCAPDCTADPVFPRWSNLEGVSGQNGG
jgi:hypothetical protein